jgi:hypothetical protein
VGEWHPAAVGRTRLIPLKAGWTRKVSLDFESCQCHPNYSL